MNDEDKPSSTIHLPISFALARGYEEFLDGNVCERPRDEFPHDSAKGIVAGLVSAATRRPRRWRNGTFAGERDFFETKTFLE
jgi:hypothetical protein